MMRYLSSRVNSSYVLADLTCSRMVTFARYQCDQVPSSAGKGGRVEGRAVGFVEGVVFTCPLCRIVAAIFDCHVEVNRRSAARRAEIEEIRGRLLREMTQRIGSH